VSCSIVAEDKSLAINPMYPHCIPGYQQRVTSGFDSAAFRYRVVLVCTNNTVHLQQATQWHDVTCPPACPCRFRQAQEAAVRESSGQATNRPWTAATFTR
jgi:hypothetical protein